MKKIISGLIAAHLLMTGAATAQAQYHEYSSGQPSVEIDLSVLDDATQSPKNYDTQTHSTVPRAPSVTQVPLVSDGQADPFGSTLDEPVPLTPPPSQQPAKKRLLKPVFTAQPQPPLPQAQEKPVIAKPTPVVHPRVPEPEYAPRITEKPAIQKEEAAPATLTDEEIVTPPPAPAPAPEKELAAPAAVVPVLEDLTLVFTGSSSEMDPASIAKLDNIVNQLRAATEGRLQVRGYASGEDGTTSSARRIALSRALLVRSYLMDKGVKPTRVDVRALGSETDKSPVDRVDLIFVR